MFKAYIMAPWFGEPVRMPPWRLTATRDSLLASLAGSRQCPFLGNSLAQLERGDGIDVGILHYSTPFESTFLIPAPQGRGCCQIRTATMRFSATSRLASQRSPGCLTGISLFHWHHPRYITPRRVWIVRFNHEYTLEVVNVKDKWSKAVKMCCVWILEHLQT